MLVSLPATMRMEALLSISRGVILLGVSETTVGETGEVDSILLVLSPIIKVVILSLVNRKGGYTTTILS
jgi:hypothetical protein